MSSPANPTAPSTSVCTGLRRAWLLYGQIFNLGIQSNLIYRWNFLARTVFSFVPLIASVAIWRAVYAGTSEFSGYSYRMMIAYFISLVLLDFISATGDQDFQMAEEIKEGKISPMLLKPMSYLSYRLSLFFGMRCVGFAVAIVPSAIALYFLRDYFVETTIGVTVLPTLLASIGSGLLQFAITYATSMLAFWLLEIGSVVFTILAFEFLVGGHMFPLDVLPTSYYNASLWLPFTYEYYFPVAIFLGKIHGSAIWYGFAAQLFWIAFFLTLGHCIWQRGLKKYTSVGG